MKRAAVFLLLTIFCLRASQGAEPSHPQVWMAPPALTADTAARDPRILRELFAKPDLWKNSRAKLDVLGIAEWQLDAIGDAELRDWLKKLADWKLKLAVEIDFLRDPDTDAGAAFARVGRAIARLHECGGRLDYLVLAGARDNARAFQKKDRACAAAECVKLLALLHQSDPDLQVGDCESYPGQDADFAAWVSAIQTGASRENGRGLDFVQMQVDWYQFLFSDARAQYSWPKVKAIEDAVHRARLPFGMRYGPANASHLDGKYNPDLAWKIGLLRQGFDYFYVRGNPDQYIISCPGSAPSRVLPETAEATFTNDLNEFCETFPRLGGIPVSMVEK